jgi:hypothetical protein
MDDGIYWMPIGDFHVPYMSKILDMTDDTIVFMGYFYIEPETLPIELLLVKNNKVYKCIINHKEFIDDEDDENRDFSAFPRHYLQSEIIEVNYKNLGVLGKTPEDDEFFKRANDKDTVKERNRTFVLAREERERKERRETWERNNPELAARFKAPTTQEFLSKEKSDS